MSTRTDFGYATAILAPATPDTLDLHVAAFGDHVCDYATDLGCQVDALNAAVDAYWVNRHTPRAIRFPAAWQAEQASRALRLELAR